MKVIIAGAGPGAKEFFTPTLVKAIRDADVVITSGRLTKEAETLNATVMEMKVGETIKYIKENSDSQRRICLVATGDTGFYSIASTIKREVGKCVDIEFICGISSFSYFAAKCGVGYEKTKLVSLHGKEGSIVPFVCYNEATFTLTGGSVTVIDIIEQLIEAELNDVILHVGENLSLEDENISHGRPAELKSLEFSPLSVVIIENRNFTNAYKTLEDRDFIRGKVPMTKKAIRNLAVSELDIKPEDVVYDIGAGTGAMTCALAIKARESMVYAVEQKDEAVDLVRKNIEKLGIKNIEIIKGKAPKGMENFPPADKVFIGGSSGNLKEIFDVILSKNSNAEILVTAVTIETLSEATELFDKIGFNTEISCVNVSIAEKLGNYKLMKAENPIYLIKGVKD